MRTFCLINWSWLTLIVLVRGREGPFKGESNFRDSSYPHPRIVLLGATGTGKSSVGNVLLGRPHDANPDKFDSSRCFQTGGGNDAMTSDVCADQGAWLGVPGRNVTIIDTPGFGDKDVKKDGKTTEKLISFLKNDIKYVDAFVLFFNGNKDRFTWSMESMIKQFENMFGPAFWDNVIIEVTFWEYDDDNIRTRNLNEETEEKFIGRRNDKFKELFKTLRQNNQDIDSVFIHPLYNDANVREKEEFEKNTEKLYRFAANTEPFPCKDIKFVLSDVEKFRQEKINLETENKLLKTKIKTLEECKNKKPIMVAGLSSGEAGGLGVGMLLLGLILGAGIMFYIVGTGGAEEEENDLEVKNHHTYSHENTGLRHQMENTLESRESRLEQVDGSAL